jgi:dihydroflavonol-4-reductase
MARGLPVVMGGARYGVVDVEDCALGHVLALEKGKPGECYHLVDENLHLSDLAHRAAQASGLPDRVIVFPDWMLALNTAFMSVIERIVPVPDVFSSDSLRGMAAKVDLSVDTTKARRELGWAPRPMEVALREVMADYVGLTGRPLPALLKGARS